MKVTRVYLECAGVVVCLATSPSAERAWDGMHRMLRGRGKRTRNAAIDLLFVVADSRDPHWYRATAPLCREAKFAVVHGVAYPELGAEQFAHGIATYYTWMIRFFDVVVTTNEQPGTVLRALLDFLSHGLVCTDFADLYAVLYRAGTCEVHQLTLSTETSIESARQLIAGDRNLARSIRTSHRMVCVVRANPRTVEMLGILNLFESLLEGDHRMLVINVVCAPDANELDVVFLSSSETCGGPKLGSDRAVPLPDDLATFGSAYPVRHQHGTSTGHPLFRKRPGQD